MSEGHHGAGEVVKSGFLRAIGIFFEYDTPKIVHIRSKKVGVINRFIQLVIIAYIIGYAIVWKKGYQQFDDAESAVTTKLKGVVYTNLSAMFNVTPVTDNQLFVDGRLWDVADYVKPPQERSAFFVMTNMVITPNQTQETCPEDPSMADVNCTLHDKSQWEVDCPPNVPVANGNGVRTGMCVPSALNHSIGVCQIHAWCPVEVDELPVPGQAVLKDSKNFTVLIKNSIEFPVFDKKRRNILEQNNDKEYLRSCKYSKDDEKDKFCPIFELDYIVKEAGTDYDEIAVKGGVIAININWDCNLDFDISYCVPEYSFRRIDDKNTKISAGWNFRYANYYQENNIDKRTLVKAYGLRFLVMVTGKAGKFSPVPLLLNIGSGLGLLAIATVLCDIVVLYIMKKGPFYKEKKYLNVVSEDAFGSGETPSSYTEENQINQGSGEHSSVKSRRPATGTNKRDYERLE